VTEMPTYTIRRATNDADLAGARAVMLATLASDFDYGYEPQWHWDLDHLREVYATHPRQAMFVAVDERGEVVATAAVIVGGPNVPPHPEWLGRSYPKDASVAQVIRVATATRHRRHGLARRLVAAVQGFCRDAGYRVIYLHTNARVAAAVPFWESLPVRQVHDARGEESDARFETVHYELDLHATVLDRPGQPDWAGWVARWDAQQTGYVADREAQFGLMFDVVERLGAGPGALLDLACGPGSLAGRAAARFPGADITGVDIDPLLLEMARRTTGERCRYLDADLRAEGWDAVLGNSRFDAVCSATALHWLDSDHLGPLADVLAARIRPGGVFVNHDSLPGDAAAEPRLVELALGLRRDAAATAHEKAAEDWDHWWAAAGDVETFVPLLAERDRRFGARRHGEGTTLTEHVEALRKAGFAEVGTITQWADRRMLVAIR
jgi:trans-aconitate methyltransferase/GNAT superfamily N-acetyltransferase